MKKLMFVAAAALCAYVFAAAIESSNIVGYAQNELKSGNSLVGAQFMAIGSDAGMPLQSVKPTGSDTSDNVYLSTLDALGFTVTTYSWVNWAGDNGDQEAWIDDDFAIVEGVKIAPGAGLWVQGSSGSQGIRIPAPEL